MSAATASIGDVSRTDRNDSSDANNSGQTQAQCTPMPLPALGSQRIIQGNGTNVGTVISLQCPAKHKLVGGNLMCVMMTNSTQWVGETYCKPLSYNEDYGFRVAVLASIVSSAIIFLMSMAFLTCCLLDCIEKDKRKNLERESDAWQWEEQAQQQEHSRSRYNHKGRNNNNNNSQEKVLSLWDAHSPLSCDNSQAYRCPQQYGYGWIAPPSARAYSPAPPLPGQDYNQPLLPPDPESAPISSQTQYHKPPPSACQTASPSLIQISAGGPSMVWQYGGAQHGTLSGITDETNLRNINSAKEFSIRIISV